MMVLYTSVLVLATFLVGCSSFSIQYYVDTAIGKGADSVVIPPGTYYSFTDATGNIANMNFTNVNNFKMYAYNVTFISTIRARALDILNCSDVAVYGLVIDYNPLTFTQGTIIDINNAYLDLKLHDGYPEASWARVMIVDPKTGLIKDGVGFMWDITANFSQPGVVRVYNTLNQGFYTAKVGDYATLAGGPDGDYACHGIGVSFSSDVSLIDVTIYAAPGFGLADWAGFGGLTLTNFQIVPGPPPAGATQERLQTTSWDGVEHTSMTRGPFVTGLRVERAGDDSWSVVGDVYPISGINAATRELILGGSPPYTLSVGNTLRLRRVDLYPDEYVTVSSIESVPPSPIHAFYCARCAAKARRQSFAASTFTVQVKESIPSNWNVSDQLFSPETTPMGFILQNSYIKSKGRGALIKAPYGIIRNNYFEGGAAGVQVSPEVAGSTGDGADVGYNMYIQGNTIVHNGYHETFNDSTYGAAGAISLFAYIPGPFALRGPDTFINMVIENNTLIDIDGINIAIVASTGVNVLNNIFYNTFPVPYGTIGTAFGFNNGYLVFLSESNNVTLDGNIVHGEGKYKLGNLYVSSSVSNLIGENGGIIQQ